MTPFDCGCTPDGSDRCAVHGDWYCHTDPLEPVLDVSFWKECPPCRIARYRSVSLSAEATPTRGKR
jgi:hypothetical protein